MTNVNLKTEAIASVECDGMEISLAVKCEGLSMQASLNRLSECSSQMMSALAQAGIDPASFSLEKLNSSARQDEGRQSASTALLCKGPADLSLLKTIWHTLAALSFGVEAAVRFTLSDEEELRFSLQSQALQKARTQAVSFGTVLGASNVSCQSASFSLDRTITAVPGTLCALEQSVGPDFTVSFFDAVRIPAIRLKAVCESVWSFE